MSARLAAGTKRQSYSIHLSLDYITGASTRTRRAGTLQLTFGVRTPWN